MTPAIDFAALTTADTPALEAIRPGPRLRLYDQGESQRP